MNKPKPKLPRLIEKDYTPLVSQLMEVVAWDKERIKELEDEILKLKGETVKPTIKPSKMEKETAVKEAESPKGKKRSKTAELEIDETIVVQPEEVIPAGAVFKGYRDVIIQDIILKKHTLCYRLAQYQQEDGRYISGQLPKEQKGSHFGRNLRCFILYQYHHQHVTQPLLHQHLKDLGIDLSSGCLSQLITQNLDVFHQEKDTLLPAGLSASRYIHTDDTGARHAGKNGYCTHIGNEGFAWFASTESKSRINFLTLLGTGAAHNVDINVSALAYMARQRLPQSLREQLSDMTVECKTIAALETWLASQQITRQRYRKIIIEGALIGGLVARGIPIDFSIISDDAGQFAVFDHALCWIHAERIINRLIPLNDCQAKAVDDVRSQIWSLYGDLKSYKLNPSLCQIDDIKQRFQALCTTKTCYATLNQALKRMGKNQYELLRVLDKPYLPLHNNLSERDIREYVKKRKISGSTRSELGRRCRDTFASLKKTCLKHGISFGFYLKDRLSPEQKIPPLADFILARATCNY